jgi:chromosome condensin MukBEF ATPase and DNA-binding subunit MukB
MKPQSATPKIDVTPALARQVIDLYAEELSEVRFPDLDLSALLYAQAELNAAQVEVERAEAELADKRAQLEERSQALLAKSERALAYARVFAQGDQQLAPRIADIGRRKSGSAALHVLDNTADAAAPKRRGRKPKTEAPEELFGESETPISAAAV